MPQIHSAASAHLPTFITTPGETDVLFYAAVAVTLAFVLGLGIPFFRIHGIPEQIARRTSKGAGGNRSQKAGLIANRK